MMALHMVSLYNRHVHLQLERARNKWQNSRLCTEDKMVAFWLEELLELDIS